MAKIWRLDDGVDIHRYFAFTDQENEYYLYLSEISRSYEALKIPKELIEIEYIAGKNIREAEQINDRFWIWKDNRNQNSSALLRLSLKSTREDIKPWENEGSFDIQGMEEYLKEDADRDYSSYQVRRVVKEISDTHAHLQELIAIPYWKAWFTFQWIRENITYSMLPREAVQNVSNWITTLPSRQQRDPYSILCASFNLRRDYLQTIADRVILPEHVTGHFETAKCIMDQSARMWGIFNFLSIGKQNASQVIRDRMGKCVGMSNLFVALCRSAGIPAMTISGYAKYPDSEGGHQWAALYLAPYGWIETDPTSGRHLGDFKRKEHCFELLDSNFPGTARIFSQGEVLSDEECMALCSKLSSKQLKKFFGQVPEENTVSTVNVQKKNLFERIKERWF